MAVKLATLAVALTLAASGVTASAEIKTAVFAGGCFWCMEPPFDRLDGVLETTSGYTGGRTESPTYEKVTYGDTGHFEAVRVRYDDAKVDYATLLDVYWRQIDPFDDSGQFCDKGSSYRAAVFVGDVAERAAAEASKRELQVRLGRPFVTGILPRATFYPAEQYHQDYYRKNPLRYKFYRSGCRRDRRLEEVWGAEGERLEERQRLGEEGASR